MKNIELSQGTSNYKDDPKKHYVRFSADFENEAESLAFQETLLKCVINFYKICEEVNKDKPNA